jgi:hypothetical protein
VGKTGTTVGSLNVRFKTVSPNQNNEEKQLFEILVRVYIDNRYKKDYSVALPIWNGWRVGCRSGRS